MNEQTRHNNVVKRLQVLAGLAATAFAVTLAVIIGNRLSDEALAVLAGAGCGVGAAIPTSLLVVAVTRRHDQARAPTTTIAPQSQGPYPPVVVIAPPSGQRWGEGGGLPTFEAPAQRRFTVVGGEMDQGSGAGGRAAPRSYG